MDKPEEESYTWDECPVCEQTRLLSEDCDWLCNICFDMGNNLNNLSDYNDWVDSNSEE